MTEVLKKVSEYSRRVILQEGFLRLGLVLSLSKDPTGNAKILLYKGFLGKRRDRMLLTFGIKCDIVILTKKQPVPYEKLNSISMYSDYALQLQRKRPKECS